MTVRCGGELERHIMIARAAGVYFAFIGFAGASVAGILSGADLCVTLLRALPVAGVMGVLGCFSGMVFSSILRETVAVEENPEKGTDKKHEPAQS